VGHRQGRRKHERELRERLCFERALDVEHKKYCPICGKHLIKMSSDNPHNREIFDALESGKCPCCGSGLRVTDEGILYCSNRPVCKWCVYVVGLGRR
jgi:transcription initiation factor IIE alpha subunit